MPGNGGFAPVMPAALLQKNRTLDRARRMLW